MMALGLMSPGWLARGLPALGPLIVTGWEGLLAGSDTLVVLNQGDLLGRGGGLVEGVGEPFLGEAAGEFQAHDALAESEDLGVVGQDGTLNGEGVVRGDGADAGDLVRGDRHTQSGAADQQGTVSLARGDEFGGSDGHGRVGGVAGGVHPDVLIGLDQFGRLQVRLQCFLVLESGVVGTDDQAQFGAHAFSLRVVFWTLSVRVLWMARTISAIETAPASGVPRLFSACGRARPIRGSRLAVSSAACWAAVAAVPQASV